MPKFEKPPKYVYSFETDEGIPDLAEILDRGHLRESFVSSMTRFKDKLSHDVRNVGDAHIRMCGKCREAVKLEQEKYREPEQMALREE